MQCSCFQMKGEVGKLVEVPQPGAGSWFVHCKWCQKHLLLPGLGNHHEAQLQLQALQWRNSMAGRTAACRNWSCPDCANDWRVSDKATVPVTPESLAGEGGATSHAVEPLADDCTLPSRDSPHAV